MGLWSFGDRLFSCDVEEADVLWEEVFIGHLITFSKCQSLIFDVGILKPVVFFCLLNYMMDTGTQSPTSPWDRGLHNITKSRPWTSSGSSGANPVAPSVALDNVRNFGNLGLFFMIATVCIFSYSVLVLPHFFPLTPMLVQSPLSSQILCNSFCLVLAAHLISITFKMTSWLKSQLPPSFLPTVAWMKSPKINWNDCFVSKDHHCFYWRLILIARGLLLTLNRYELCI